MNDGHYRYKDSCGQFDDDDLNYRFDHLYEKITKKHKDLKSDPEVYLPEESEVIAAELVKQYRLGIAEDAWNDNSN